SLPSGALPSGRPSRSRTRSGGVHAWIVLSGGSARSPAPAEGRELGSSQGIDDRRRSGSGRSSGFSPELSPDAGDQRFDEGVDGHGQEEQREIGDRPVEDLHGPQGGAFLALLGARDQRVAGVQEPRSGTDGDDRVDGAHGGDRDERQRAGD